VLIQGVVGGPALARDDGCAALHRGALGLWIEGTAPVGVGVGIKPCIAVRPVASTAFSASPETPPTETIRSPLTPIEPLYALFIPSTIMAFSIRMSNSSPIAF